jgi:hypothetical protein
LFSSRSLLKLALTTALILEAGAVELQACGTSHHPACPGMGQAVKRTSSPFELGPIVGDPNTIPTQKITKRAPPPLELRAISDPGVLLRGRSEKREMPGNGCFDPSKHSTFFWGGYSMCAHRYCLYKSDTLQPATTSLLQISPCHRTLMTNISLQWRTLRSG